MENAQLIFTSQFSITTGAWNSIPFIRRVTIWGYSECVHDSPSRQMSVVQYQTAARTDNAAAGGQQFTDGSDGQRGCYRLHFLTLTQRWTKASEMPTKDKARNCTHISLFFSLLTNGLYSPPSSFIYQNLLRKISHAPACLAKEESYKKSVLRNTRVTSFLLLPARTMLMIFLRLLLLRPLRHPPLIQKIAPFLNEWTNAGAFLHPILNLSNKTQRQVKASSYSSLQTEQTSSQSNTRSFMTNTDLREPAGGERPGSSVEHFCTRLSGWLLLF